MDPSCNMNPNEIGIFSELSNSPVAEKENRFVMQINHISERREQGTQSV